MSSDALCACGCGQPVKHRRYPSQGQPRFLQGHQHKGSNNGNYRGGKSNQCCPVCNQSFETWVSHQRVTCGKRECYSEWQRLTTAARGQNKSVVTCDHCGGELRLYPSQVQRYNYCNRFCQGQHHGTLFSGVNNGRWKGGMWRYFQEQARLRDNYRCVVCGFDLTTDVHHITPRKQGGTDGFSNLITLCPNHHRLADLGIINVEHLRNTDWMPEHTATPLPDSASHSRTG